MKKLSIVIIALLLASTAHAGWNLNLFGSNDRQHKHPIRPVTTTNDPVSVPEPASIILLGSGLAGLIAAKRKIK